MSGVDICLNLLQATALANEVNLAKNLATTSVNLSNSNTTKLQDINIKINNTNAQLLSLTSKLENLCNRLEAADLSGDFLLQNYSYSTL